MSKTMKVVFWIVVVVVVASATLAVINYRSNQKLKSSIEPEAIAE